MSGILDQDALKKLSKDDLIKYAINVSNISSQVDVLTVKFDDLAARLERSESDVAILKNVNTRLLTKIDVLESKMIAIEKVNVNNSQYLRNRQIEVKKVPTDITPVDLKIKMAELLSLTGVNVQMTDIDKCHRLSNQNNVIMEFRTRETRDSVLRGRKNLKDKDTELEDMNLKESMILESLCPEYATMDFVCRKLKKRHHISQTWFFNGKLWVKVLDLDDKVNIAHINDLYSMFGPTIIDECLAKPYR